jgi:selenocysteine-specific elongation factor
MNPARQSITVATAGHVDHGKTTLVNWITGTDTDTLVEEKTRGLSINLGFAYYHLPKPENSDGPELTIGFVDVPGHTDFINNALAGIGTADFALLVVAADDGVMPQTREHLAIINLLGIAAGAVVITKIDKATAEQQDITGKQVNQLTAGTAFGEVPVFPVCAQSGAGMAALMEHLENLARECTIRQLPDLRHPRFTIDRSFTVKGIGTVVTGTVISGTMTDQDSLLHSGTGKTARVRGLRHDRREVNHAVAGERVAVNVSLQHQQITRGEWLMAEAIFNPVHRVDVRLELLEPLIFKSGVSYHFYHGTAHRLVQIRQLSPDSSTYFQINSTEPLFGFFGDRFILRDPACTRTIGGGIIIDSFVPRRGRSSDERLQALRAMDQEDYAALCSLIKQSPGGVDLQQFANSRNCTPQGMENLLNQLADHQVIFTRLEVGQASIPVALHNRFLEEAEQQVLEALAKYHRDQPSQAGVAEPTLSKLVEFEKSHLLFHAILDNLIDNKKIKRTGTLLHLPDHIARLSEEEKQFLDLIRPILIEAEFLPPRTRELVDLTGMKLGSLERILAQARKSGNLIQVAPNRHYLPETMVKLAEFTESLADGKEDGFTVIEFRDQLGIGRNLCIEILEYFDRSGFTVRDGNSRYLRTSRENLFGKLKANL